MKTKEYVAFALLIIAVIVLASMVSSLSGKIESQEKRLMDAHAAMENSRTVLQRQVDSLRMQVPGLGEYMSGIQMHIAKLWFAGRATNWDLASYELNELGEAMEGAEALHAKRDSVNVTGVLQSLHDTQIESLKRSIAGKQRKAFLDGYGQTLDACNGCHRAAGYSFIHIVTPSAPPVTNQRWEPANR